MTHSTKTPFIRRGVLLGAALLLLLVALVPLAAADSYTTDFESFTIGDVNGQQGWSKTGPFDVDIIDQASLGLTLPGFGSRSLRISSATTSGSFGDHTISASTTDEAGETDATNAGKSGGSRQPFFDASFDIASAVPGAEQPGLFMQVSPDRGDGARMSYVGFEDTPTGLDIIFYDYVSVTAGTCDGTFPLTTIASGLDRTKSYNIRITMEFVDGLANDIVKVYLDGVLAHVGTSWEDYFRDCEPTVPNSSRTVDSLIFLTRATAAPGTSGFGFLVDNVNITTGPVPPNCTTTCYADPVNGDDANDGITSGTAKKTLQAAVDDVDTGGTVIGLAGTFTETVTVPRSMTISGAGKTMSNIAAPSTLPVAADPDSAIVIIDGPATSVELSGFNVHGPGPSACGSIGAGIYVRNDAYANIHDNAVTDIRDTGLSGCQNGIGVRVGNASTPTSGTADIVDNLITGYQKGGIVISGAGSDATISGNTVAGDGPVTYIAENGIQVSSAATATINSNTVSGHSYTPLTFASAGLLLYEAGVVDTDGNIIDENQVGLWIVDSSGDHLNNIITATSAGTGSPGFWGAIVDAPPPGRVPSPMEDAVAAGGVEDVTTLAPSAVQTNLIMGNSFVSDGSLGGVGIETDAGFGNLDIDLTVTKNIIHNWEYGVFAFECTGPCAPSTFVKVDINRNSIVGNTEFGVFSFTATPIVDATCNWWGLASGPGPVGPGSGDNVSDDVEYEYWLLSDNLDGYCGPPPENACPVDPAVGTVGNELTTLIGTGMGSPTRTRMVAKVVIPNAGNLVELYGQMAAKEYNGVKYVRFIYGNKTYDQIQPETDLGDTGAISWWGADLDTSLVQAKPFVKGRWFLHKGMKKMKLPRAIVMYPTHSTVDQYANAWSTFGAPTNFVAGTPGFDQTNTNVLAIPETQDVTDIVIQVAVTDVNRDARSVDVIITAGSVAKPSR